MMKEKKRSKTGIVVRIVLIILCCVVAVFASFAALYPKAVGAVWGNVTSKKLQLPEKDDWTGGKSLMKVPYASDSESQYLDLYIPDTGEASGGKLPQLYVIIHGGGFITNDSQSRQAQLMYRYFRDHGYACATVNYRLAQEAQFPAALSDCKAAIRFLRAHAEEYGYDARKLPVFGESAGGYLATMCSVTDDSQFSEVSFIGEENMDPVSGEVDLLVDYYGHIENEGAEEDWKTLGIPALVRRVANSWVSGSATRGYEDVESFWFRKNVSEMTPEEKAKVNPYTYIDSHDLEKLSVWIIHGDADLTVPYLQSERLAAHMKQKLGDDRVSYTLYPGQGHAGDMLYSDEVLDGLKEYMDAHLK
jgi:acetyl esterase/lipase